MQALYEKLQETQVEAVRFAAAAADLQVQVDRLQAECQQARSATKAAEARQQAADRALHATVAAKREALARLQDTEAEKVAAEIAVRRQRTALAAVARGFEDVAVQLATAQGQGASRLARRGRSESARPWC